MNNIKEPSSNLYINNQIESIKKKIWEPSKDEDPLILSLKTAAVLVILTNRENNIQLLFTHRTNTVNDHKDQVSFPGGVKETKDISLLNTAFREAYEEIGISFSQIDLIGKLYSQQTPTGYQIFPFVVYKEKLENININHSEVKNVFYIPLNWLNNPHHYYQKNISTSYGIRHKVIYFNKYNEEVVWGITARILVDFINLISK